MHLLIIALIAFSNLICSHVNGLDEEHRAAYERVAECASAATHADLPEDHPEAVTLACDTTKAFYACIIKPFNSGSNSEILDFTRAYVLQHVFLLNKENICPEPLPYKELKDLVDKSRIMEKENLPSIDPRIEHAIRDFQTELQLTDETNLAENDEYVPCEGEIRNKCSGGATELWVHHANGLQQANDFIDCYTQEAPKCDFPITRHYTTLLQAMKKHLGEKHGLLGGMLQEIKQ